MEQGTADPADLAPLAFQMLLSSPKQLFRLRSKLKHIILDEYQDISVSQHQLIRLIVRGIVDELTTRNETSKNPSSTNIPPVLTFPGRGERVVDPCPFDVPQLFCAGDGQQSIYGFRGAAPQLSVDGFREDFPQSVITQLETSFRLSDSSWSAAKSLLHNRTGNPATVVQTFKQSPIGQARARAILFESLNQCSSSIDIESLSDLLSEELVDELTNSIHIQGVWDSREEAKYIAGMIKRRAKERVSRITGFQHGNFTFVDPSEVAIIVRAANQLQLLREALANVGIPYSDKNTDIPPVIQSAPTMKPVVLLTMHSAKGEEFDDIYLPGWTEGVFPHPSAVSSNRVDEERRLAFVAISRSRHRVVITHAFVRRALQKGPRLGNKMVTMQVRPSRFLYELVPDGMHMTGDIVDNINAVELAEDDKHLPSITWDRSQGSKGMIAGTNLPEYFQKSYHAPEGFDPPSLPPLEAVSVKRQFPEPVTSTRPATKQPKKKKSMPDSNDDDDDTNTPTVLTPTNLTGSEIHQVLQNVNEILSGKRGSSTSSKKEFLSLLKSNFGFIKGKIDLYVFEDPVKQLDRLTLETFQSFVLDNAIVASTRPLSQSSALQIGLFLLYSLSINPCA
jgi:DNA helicase-2/ATP-dependent DNA helicase PcrA